MADPTMDVAELSDSQQQSLQQLMSVTGQELDEAATLLQRSQWNVQVAISKFFDGDTADPMVPAPDDYLPPPQQARRQETLMDGWESPSQLGESSSISDAPRIVPQTEAQTRWQPSMLVRIGLSPVGLLYRLIKSILRPFFFLFPFLKWVIPRSDLLSTHSRTLAPRETAVKVKQYFEERYGPSEIPFFEEGYAQAQDRAKRELKFLLVVLFSPENEGSDQFIRSTMFSESFLSLTKDPASNLILWVGNVQNTEAYQVSSSLKCTKLPFSALVCLEPQHSTTKLRVVARIDNATSAEDYAAYFRSKIDEYSEALDTVRSTRAAQDAERSYRDAQNAAYQRSLEIDRERTRQKREAEESEKALALQSAREEQQRAELERKRRQWRRWRSAQISAEPTQATKDVVRISLRMPWGERIVRRFAGDASMEELYAFVDCKRAVEENGEEEVDANDEKAACKPEGYEHEHGFILVSPLPRKEFSSDAQATIRERVGRSGNLMVEVLDGDDEDEDE